MARSHLVIELASDARFAQDLAAGGVFVPGCALPLAEECDLLVCGANRELLVPARVVYVDEYRGAGLELIGFTAELKAQLASLEPVGRLDVEVVDEPIVVDSAFDRAALDDIAPADDDAGYAPAESVAVIDVDALADAAGDDLAIPIAAPRTLSPRGSITGGFDPDGDAGATLAFDAEAMARTATMDVDSFILGRNPLDDEDAAAAPDREAMARTATVSLADAGLDEGALARTPTVDADEEAGPAARDPGATLVGHTGAPRPGDTFTGDAGATLTGDPGATLTGLDGGEPQVSAARAQAMHERLRGLTLAAQHRIASHGELHERILLERLYGKNVWEPLLRNPRLTAPEVSRIARYGALPRVLLELIVGNAAWLAVPEVRRALLSNPRLGADQILRVLRLAPKHELKLASTQIAYPHAVRSAAKQMIARGD